MKVILTLNLILLLLALDLSGSPIRIDFGLDYIINYNNNDFNQLDNIPRKNLENKNTEYSGLMPSISTFYQLTDKFALGMQLGYLYNENNINHTEILPIFNNGTLDQAVIEHNLNINTHFTTLMLIPEYEIIDRLRLQLKGGVFFCLNRNFSNPKS